MAWWSVDLVDLGNAFASTRGVVTVRMLVDRGCPQRTARRWIESGELVRVCGQAFVRRGRAITILERAIGARLTWPDAIVCFLTAAVLHGLKVEDDGVVHVLVPSLRRALPGVQPHFWSVRPTEVVLADGLVLTDRPTTIADCLGRMPNDDGWGLLAWMFTRDDITARDLERQLESRHGMYGVVRLRAMTAALHRGAVSMPEVQLQTFLEEFGFTGWSGNAVVRRHGRIVARADVGFPERRLAIEYDGAAAHGPERRARDERRTAKLHSAGWDVLRVRWVPLHDRRRLLRDTIRALLAEPDGVRRRSLCAAWNEARYRDLTLLLEPASRELTPA